MTDRPYRTLWAAIVCGLIVSLAGCTTVAVTPTVVGSTAAGPGAVALPPPPSAPVGPPEPVRVLQLNLCNSGIAACFTGRSTAEAADAIREAAPDLIALNEACSDDLEPLRQALAEVVPGDGITSAFQAARDRTTGEAYRCVNGEEFGNGLISRWPSVPGSTVSGIHPTQDPNDPEERSFVCLDAAATPPVGLCTTHLAYTDRDVAIAQCTYLSDTVIAQQRARSRGPVVLAADLNLGSADNAGLQECLPDGAVPVDDGGGPQIVAATPEFVVDDVDTIDLRRSTDHPGLLVTLAPAA